MISKNYKFEKEMEDKKSERVFKRNLCKIQTGGGGNTAWSDEGSRSSKYECVYQEDGDKRVCNNPWMAWFEPGNIFTCKD